MGKIKDFLIGKTRGEALSPYANALNEASAARNTAAARQEYAKNYLSSHQDLDKNSNLYSALNQMASDDYVKQYDDVLNQYQSSFDKAKKQNEWNLLGNGLLGGTINSAAQSFSALDDLTRSGAREWKNGNRDALSDIGAGIETGLNIASAGAAAGAGSAAKAGAQTLGKTIGKTALTGAAYGGLGSVGNYLKTQGKDATLGGAALYGGIGAATGAGVGGLAGASGYGIGKLAQKAQNVRTLQDMYNAAYAPGMNGQTTNLLGSGGAEPVVDAATEWLKSRKPLSNNPLGQAIQGVQDYISYANINGNNPISKISNSKIGKLASTKLGKAAMVGGGAYGLSQLLKGKNKKSNSGLSDMEAQALYNYYYGGQ